MEITETLYVKTRKEWRKWLEKNHMTCKEIWLIYYKKNSDKPRIPYDDAVEEALCFGWIDSTVKRGNEEFYLQRFTPRKKKSEWSLLNIIRIKKLIELGVVKEAGYETIRHLDINKTFETLTREKNQTTEIPGDIVIILKSNSKALHNFNNLSASEKRLYIKWVNDTKMNTTRNKRISEMLAMLEKGLKIGMK